MLHIHRYVVTSSTIVNAEGKYPMRYTDSKCKCSKQKGRYSLP